MLSFSHAESAEDAEICIDFSPFGRRPKGCCARVDSGTSTIGLTYIYNINSSNHENIALMVASMTATEQKKRDSFHYVEGML